MVVLGTGHSLRHHLWEIMLSLCSLVMGSDKVACIGNELVSEAKVRSG